MESKQGVLIPIDTTLYQQPNNKRILRHSIKGALGKKKSCIEDG